MIFINRLLAKIDLAIIKRSRISAAEKRIVKLERALLAQEISASHDEAEPNDSDAKNWEMYEKAVQRLIHFANEFPVHSVRWKDMPLWPFFRYWLSRRIFLKIFNRKNLDKSAAPAGVISLNKIWHDAFITQHNAVEIDNYESESVDFLFFVNMVTVAGAQINGLMYDRLIDPLVGKFRQYGTAKKICVLRSPSIVPAAYEKPDLIVPPISYTGNIAASIDIFPSFCEKIIGEFNEMVAIDHNKLAHVCNLFANEYIIYLKILKKVTPKAVFFFAMDIKYPLLLAAKTLKIPCVDIQHGNLPGTYLQYNNWPELIPHTQAQMLPDIFLIWGQREREHLKNVFGSVKTVIGGYPWLDFMQSLENMRLPKDIVLFCSKYDYIVIISLGSYESLPDILNSIIQDPRSHHFRLGFIFKPHPRYNKFIGIGLSPNCYYNDKLSATPFSFLCQHAHLHMTEGSASLMEADYYGVQTFVFGGAARHHFADLEEDGRITRIASADDFFENFEHAVSSCLWPRLIDNSSHELDEFARSIMDNAHGRGEA